MKKFLIGFALFLCIFAAIAGWIYSNSTKPIKAVEDKVISIARKDGGLDEKQRFRIYNGKETVYVVEGKNKKGESIIVWIPEKQKGKAEEEEPVVRLAGDGISKNEAIRKVQEEKNPEKIISARLGMEDGIPFWEVYYTSGNNLMNYYYINFDTGEMHKRIENL
ncbi:cell wall elongation regulator TseB-like domain-containing protein [Bacillus sp. B-jedd]|uniref:cell wall elongation regulator TseB-like domain-containing protein n=1 Tax=Bacillus sp. B-jedd TaxID=1476857 RepID=UPI000515578B|nr:DUF5590 domain-containing protein [Bacillus sp. B-jedd]CEG27626.1 Hypothetical protein BN1002_02496 [Bacillus sp. B-jedd]